jgi:hypothetical protein
MYFLNIKHQGPIEYTRLGAQLLYKNGHQIPEIPDDAFLNLTQHPTGGEAVLGCNELRDSEEVRRGHGPVQHGAILIWEASQVIWADTAPGRNSFTIYTPRPTPYTQGFPDPDFAHGPYAIRNQGFPDPRFRAF